MKQVAEEFNIAELFNQFNKSRYPDKVVLFDRHFGLIPFDFPSFDISLSWYLDPAQLNTLTDILNIERRELRSLYRKAIPIGKKIYRFSVLPVYIPERKFLNEYVLDKFLNEKHKIKSDTLRQLSEAPSKKIYLEEKIAAITHWLDWVPKSLKTNPSSIQAKFLQIFYNGILAANSGKVSTLTIRRKFVELYLYAQGLLMMDYLNYLSSIYEAMVPGNSVQPLPLRLKLVALHELGVLDLIRSRFDLESNEHGLEIIATIVSLITSEHTANYNEVYRTLSILGTGHPKDCLTESNLRYILNKFGTIANSRPAH